MKRSLTKPLHLLDMRIFAQAIQRRVTFGHEPVDILGRSCAFGAQIVAQPLGA